MWALKPAKTPSTYIRNWLYWLQTMSKSSTRLPYFDKQLDVAAAFREPDGRDHVARKEHAKGRFTFHYGFKARPIAFYKSTSWHFGHCKYVPFAHISGTSNHSNLCQMVTKTRIWHKVWLKFSHWAWRYQNPPKYRHLAKY